MTGPFQYLDPPSVQVLNQPPPLPTFVDGQVVRQSALNALSVNLRYLKGAVLGGRAGGKPLTVLRAVLPTVCPSGAATLIRWDVADQNTDNAWSLTADPYSVIVQTEGIYRIYFQCGTTASHSNCKLYLLVNGNDVINNSASVCSWFGNHANVELTVALAKTASVQVAYMQTTGSSRSTTNQFGGARLEVEFVAP